MRRNLDFITFEIGSTITKVNGFSLSDDKSLIHLAQGFSKTTIDQNDVEIGLSASINDMNKEDLFSFDGSETFINSSAAGGLRVTVHGLTYNMTARAAREASLGAGAIILMITAGELDSFDKEEIISINPNMIILAGGVEHGAKEIVLKNAKAIASLNLAIPVLYAGNSSNISAIKSIFSSSLIELSTVANVFPEVDVLDVEPLRYKIQDIFAKKIIHAPGMQNISKRTKHPVIPTPGAVLKATEIFSDIFGDTIVVDVGGATTDIHSVTDGSEEYSRMLTDPEPRSKRTVEGDLGVFVNAINIIDLYPNEARDEYKNNISSIPQSHIEHETTSWLCKKAVDTAIKRHAGKITDLFTPSGKKQVVRGKDLSSIANLIGTGGALTKTNSGYQILKSICSGTSTHLMPPNHAKIFLDHNYLFSALGTIALVYPDIVANTFKKMEIFKND